MGETLEGKSNLISITPTLTTSAYTADDQMGSAMELAGALDDSSGTGAVLSVVVIDKDQEAPAFDILFFGDKPTVASSDNAALNITDAEMASKYLGTVSIESADYETLSANNTASKKAVGLLLKAIKSGGDNPNGTSVWVVLQAKGAPTFTAATDLTIKIGIVQD